MYYYHISRIWFNEIITTSAFSVDLEKSLPEGTTTHCSACEKRDHATWCEDHAMGKARSSTSADAIRDEDEYDGYACTIYAGEDTPESRYAIMWHWTC